MDRLVQSPVGRHPDQRPERLPVEDLVAWAHAVDDRRAQLNADDPKLAKFQKRYPKAVVRDFGGNPARITEMDALVGYLQMLGTLVDFKLYDDKANLR